MAEVYVTGGAEVQALIKRAVALQLDGIRVGLLRCALRIIARAKAIAPEDTTTLVQSIHSDNKVTRSGDVARVEVGAHAISGDENYGWQIHEDQEYVGPNVGGSREIGLGPKTEAKGVSRVFASDGRAGGKYMTRPIANAPEEYAEIIGKTISEQLDGKGTKGGAE